MTLKRTPGRWHWELVKLDNGDERVIFADENNNEIHPTLGDIKLLEAAPEMYGMLSMLRDLWKSGAIITHSDDFFGVSKLLARIDGKKEINS